MLWKIEGKNKADYIRADSLDIAKKIFDEKHGIDGVSFQVIDHPVHAVYFDDFSSPAYFKGTKTDARKGGNLYIKQWGLHGVKIDRIETL